MNEELPVDDRDASRSPAPDRNGPSDVPGSTNSLDNSPDFHRNCNTSRGGDHKLGVTIDDGVGFDVIGVHGLHGQSRATWSRVPTEMPFNTWLADAFSDATSKPGRIILYGYDSSESSARCYTLRGVYQEAEAMLDKLLSLRSPDMASVRRPIYFVSHDIGGLVVKAAMVLAKSNPEKYSDIVNSTRALVFVGYPHAPRTRVALHEQISRLLSLKKDTYPEGDMERLASSLSDTIVEVNGAFIHTKMMIQVMLVNIISIHEDSAQRVFNAATAIWASPFEYILSSERPHLELTTEFEEDGEMVSPLKDLPYRNWLAGDLSNDLFRALGDLVHHAAPIYPLLERGLVSDNGELSSLVETTSSRIVHIQCPHGAGRASEMVRNYLNVKRAPGRILLYHRFSAHDVRFNNMKDMLATFIAQITYSQIETLSSYINTMVKEYDASKAQTMEDMFYYWDFLRGDSHVVEALHVLGCLDECDDSALWFLSQFQSLIEKAKAESAMRIVIVTTKGTAKGQLIADALSRFPSDLVARMDYTPPSPPPLQAGFNLSMLVQEDRRYAGNGLQDDLRGLFSACADDDKLCRLLVESLKANQDYPISVPPPLLEYSKTRNPELVFESILGQMPEEQQPWAQKILSWVLMSLRPLRASEFCRVSDLCLRGEDETAEGQGGSQLAVILRYFLGLLDVVDGEVQFSHPAIRAWLGPKMEDDSDSGASKAWYRRASARVRHLDIVQACLEHLRDDTHPTETWAVQLPYAIQFWTSHYKQVGPVDGVAEIIFGSEPVLRRWISAYTPSLDEASHGPLPVAAHFGLEDIVSRLLAEPGAGDDSGERGRALVEASRTGELPALRLILASYPSGLEFHDVYLHDAMKAAASCPNRELFRELVDHIPRPPHSIPQPLQIAPTKPPIALEIPDGRSKNKDPFRWLADILFRACCVGEDDIVKKLISLGATPNPPQSLFVSAHTPLHAAAIRCHAKTSKVLVAAGASLTARNDLGRTPLHSAAAYGSHEVTKLLLDHGAAIDAKDETGWTPLDIACVWGKLAAVEALLDYRASNGSALTDSRNGPLAIAADLGYYGMTEVFLRHGLDPNGPGSDEVTALFQAVRNNRIDICRLLLDAGADPDLTPDGAMPPLIGAVSVGNLDLVKLLVEHGADIEKKEGSDDTWQRTPLGVATCYGKVDIVRYLLSKNADPNTPDVEGETALCSAARYGHTEILRLLAEAKADVNCTYGDHGETPLHAAIRYPDTVSALLECGADASIVSGPRGTPLEHAIIMDCPDTIKAIIGGLKDKPDLTLTSTQDALRYAVYKNYVEVVSLVLEEGADVNSADNEDSRTLMGAAMECEGPEDMVRAILEYRPDMDFRDRFGKTALHRIERLTPVVSVRLLVNAGAKLDAMDNERFTPLMAAIWKYNERVFRYLMGRPAVAATLSMASMRDRATPLHLACERGNSEIVQMLIEGGSDVNFDCAGRYGTPLVAATLHTWYKREHELQEMIQLLLENGATPTTSSGNFGHPIISASLACSVKTLELLINAGSPVDVQDPFNRKPVHLACYNSLEVLEALGVPDSDFAARDAVGRVPLHYAVLTGDVGLVEEVAARSERAGVGIDVQDKDGWTPLLWASRDEDVEMWGGRRFPAHDKVISFLLSKGASTTTSAPGLLGEWTALDIAYYHNASSIVGLLVDNGTQRKASGLIKIGGPAHTCTCCLLNIRGVYFTCTTCFDSTALCFKCYGSRETVHPHHGFKEEGYEWGKPEETQFEPMGSGQSDDGQSQPDFMGDDFDDEIVGDDDGSVVPDTEGSAAVGDEAATVASLTSPRRPIASIKSRVGAHR